MSCAETGHAAGNVEGATLWAAWPRATWTSRRAYESRRTLASHDLRLVTTAHRNDEGALNDHANKLSRDNPSC